MLGTMELLAIAAPFVALGVLGLGIFLVLRHFRKVGRLEGELEERRRRDREG